MSFKIDPNWIINCLVISWLAISTGCTGVRGADEKNQPLQVMATESFLADMAQQVAGEAFIVETLIPAGLDPHAYEPTPRDLAKIADSDILIVNGAGLEGWLDPILDNVDGERLVIEASHGLTSRTADPAEPEHDSEEQGHAAGEVDPHFWLDPNLVIHYVTNIRDGFVQVDPAGSEEYQRNAEKYSAELRELDGWIRQEVDKIPPENRILVTNHESLGYFADRYGFRVVGTIIPSASTSASPSARHIAELIDQIDQSGAKAIFLETGTNPDLAEQIASETGVRVVYGLASHSLEPGNGAASSYTELIKYNVQLIVEALR